MSFKTTLLSNKLWKFSENLFSHTKLNKSHRISSLTQTLSIYTTFLSLHLQNKMNSCLADVTCEYLFITIWTSKDPKIVPVFGVPILHRFRRHFVTVTIGSRFSDLPCIKNGCKTVIVHGFGRVTLRSRSLKNKMEFHNTFWSRSRVTVTVIRSSIIKKFNIIMLLNE